MQSENQRVTVSVRIRPKLENAANALHCSERYEAVACTAVSDTTLRLWDGKSGSDSRRYAFAYDHIFDVDTPQGELYEATAVDAVDAVLMGTNATLLTYGQTGSGKTHTVLGGIRNNPLSTDIVTEDTGVLMRAVEDILGYVERVKAKRHVVVGISAVEIYMDEIRDLLNPNSDRGTPVHAAMLRDIVRLPNLTYTPLESLNDALLVYKRAASTRVQRATAANDTSSRSHAIFTIEVFQTPVAMSGGSGSDGRPSARRPPTLAQCIALREDWVLASIDPQRPYKPVKAECFAGVQNALLGTNQQPVLYSKLTVADLAGSEKAKHANVRDDGFDELRKINASLTALGNVVHHLFEGSKHVPYRDSKLTMVLRDAFATPDARIVLVVNVSPTVLTLEETLSSLYFADKVKGMKADPTSISAQEAKLQEAYLSSLRTHDALLADLRICACANELDSVTVLPTAAVLFPSGQDNPLLSPTTHTAVPPSATKTAALQRLCQSLKVTRALNAPAAKLQRLLTEERQSVCREIVMDYRGQFEAVQAELAAVSTDAQAANQKFALKEAKMAHALREAKQTGAAATQWLLQMQQQREGTTAKLRSYDTLLAHTEQQIASLLNETAPNGEECGEEEAQQCRAAVALAKHQDEVWADVSRWMPCAVEVATLSLTWAELYAANVTPSRAAHSISSDSTSAPPTVRGGPQHTDPRAAPQAVEEWLRAAVWAMAGNAVTQSLRKAKQQQHRASNGVLQPLENYSNTTRQWQQKQQPKYWTIKRLQEEQEKHQQRKEGGAVAVQKPRRHSYSLYDDPALVQTILSYMDMGAPLRKVGRDGHVHRRVFFTTTHKSSSSSSPRGTASVTVQRLCWDEPGQSTRLEGTGHVDLHSVTALLLGQSTPAFLSCKDTCALEEAVAASFSVAYRVKSKKNETKYVDVVCGSVEEMESWVIGLSKLSGVVPRYAESAEPLTAAEETQQTSDIPLSGPDVQLCRSWHIPADTLITVQREVNARRVRRERGMLPVTPGQLRQLTNLNIFQASALWRHLRRAQLVENPLPQLFDYLTVTSTAATKGSSPSPSASSAPATQKEGEKPESAGERRPTATAAAAAVATPSLTSVCSPSPAHPPSPRRATSDTHTGRRSLSSRQPTVSTTEKGG